MCGGGGWGGVERADHGAELRHRSCTRGETMWEPLEQGSDGPPPDPKPPPPAHTHTGRGGWLPNSPLSFVIRTLAPPPIPTLHHLKRRRCRQPVVSVQPVACPCGHPSEGVPDAGRHGKHAGPTNQGLLGVQEGVRAATTLAAPTPLRVLPAAAVATAGDTVTPFRWGGTGPVRRFPTGDEVPAATAPGGPLPEWPAPTTAAAAAAASSRSPNVVPIPLPVPVPATATSTTSTTTTNTSSSTITVTVTAVTAPIPRVPVPAPRPGPAPDAPTRAGPTQQQGCYGALEPRHGPGFHVGRGQNLPGSQQAHTIQ